MDKNLTTDRNEAVGRSIKALNTLYNRYKLRECFFKDYKCSSEIIEAHSIQKNRILKNISKDGHIMMFEMSHDESHNWEPKTKGLNKATVFTGFCKYHDQEIFKPIDLCDYKEGNNEQEFLFAYRALAKEHNLKLSITNSFENLLEWAKKKNQLELKKHHFIKKKEDIINIEKLIPQFTHTLKELKAASKCLNNAQNKLNNNLNSDKYNNIVTRTIALKNKYPIACSSCISLEKDFDGNLINDMTKLNIGLKYMFLTIFPQHNHTYILLSFFRKHKSFFRFIDMKILDKSEYVQKRLITNLLLKHVENFAISPYLWKSFSEETKNSISKAFSDNILFWQRDLKEIEDLNLFV